MARSFSRAEIERHNKDGDMWLTIDGRVYDVSRFAAMHPGGEAFIAKYAGKASDAMPSALLKPLPLSTSPRIPPIHRHCHVTAGHLPPVC